MQSSRCYVYEQYTDLFRQGRAQKGKQNPKCCNSSHGSAGGLRVGVPLLQQRNLRQGQGHQRRPSQQPCAWWVTQSQLQDIIQEQAAPCQSCNGYDEVQRRRQRQPRLELVLGLKQDWSSDSSNDGYDGTEMRLQSSRLIPSTCIDRVSYLTDHSLSI